MKKTYCFATINAAFLLLVSFSMLPEAAGELYKWVDNQGNVTYQSSPPPYDAVKVETPKIRTGKGDAANKVATEKSTVKKVGPVTFYSTEECTSCKAIREYLEENGIPFEEINLTENKTEAEKLKKSIGYISAPTFAIGDKYVSGFEKNMLKNILMNEGYNFPPEEGVQ